MIMSNKHNTYDLEQMQSLPLEAKINMTKTRLRAWQDYWQGNVYISFSGGKDSTVLKHIADSMMYPFPAVFVNTGLEYPEIQNFVREIKAGKYDCFDSNVEILRPEMRFDEVIKKYGYPVVSKEISKTIKEARIGISRNDGTYIKSIQRLNGTMLDKNGDLSTFNAERWGFLLDAPFAISERCCDMLKKNPVKKYEKETGAKPIIGTLASESKLRRQAWIRNGCNSFSGNRPKSQPLSFWTEQDILHYIKKYDVPYCPIYGDIKIKTSNPGQVNMIDYLGCYESEDILETTGRQRTGCMFCMFGCHLEKTPNRFQTMKHTHPKQYEYCMNNLGIKEVLEYMGVPYD